MEIVTWPSKHLLLNISSQVWCCTPVILALGGRQEDQEIKASFELSESEPTLAQNKNKRKLSEILVWYF